MKINLRELEEDVRAWVFHHDETLALIRVARAAKKVREVDINAAFEMPDDIILAYETLDAALSDIEDTQE